MIEINDRNAVTTKMLANNPTSRSHYHVWAKVLPGVCATAMVVSWLIYVGYSGSTLVAANGVPTMGQRQAAVLKGAVDVAIYNTVATNYERINKYVSATEPNLKIVGTIDPDNVIDGENGVFIEHEHCGEANRTFTKSIRLKDRAKKSGGYTHGEMLQAWMLNAHRSDGIRLNTFLPAPEGNYTCTDEQRKQISQLKIDPSPFKDFSIASLYSSSLSDDELQAILVALDLPDLITFNSIDYRHKYNAQPSVADQICIAMIRMNTYLLLGAEDLSYLQTGGTTLTKK